MSKETKAVTLAQMRYFVRVAEIGSMSAAAQELYVAQSAVSMAIAQLEQIVGCQLLIRRRAKGVALTGEGKTFYAHCSKVLTQVNDAVDSLRPGSLKGRLTVGCFTTLAPFWIPDIIEQILVEHPDLEVDIREYDADELEKVLARREVEAALAYDFDYGRGVEFIPIGNAPIYAAFGDLHRYAGAEGVKLADLEAEPLVLLDLGKSSNYFLSVFRNMGVRPSVKYRFGNFDTVRSMVARGYGYTILNQSPVHNLTNEGLRLNRVPILDVDEGLRFGIIKREGETLSLRAEIFMNAIRDISKARQ